MDLASESGIAAEGSEVTVSQAVKVGGITCEVQQLLGESAIRCVAMEGTDGLRRGEVAEILGGPICVPVGRSLDQGWLVHDCDDLWTKGGWFTTATISGPRVSMDA